MFVLSMDVFLNLKRLDRKGLLLLDNATTIPDVDELKYGEIKAPFLPLNLTALCQPRGTRCIAKC